MASLVVDIDWHDRSSGAHIGIGPNGLAFDASGANLYIASTATDQVLKLRIAGGMPTVLAVFADGINGADGIVFDSAGRLVTNLALPLTPTVGDEPEEKVTTYTVSRIPLQGHGR